MDRARLFIWYRVLIVVMVGALAVTAYLALRGPLWFQRYYYPLAYTAEISAAAERHRINPYLVAAVINEESGFRPDVVSRAGAVGLMQVMPGTADELRLRGIVSAEIVEGRTLDDPVANIEYGTAYLRYLVDRYHEIETVLAAYNAGLRHADSWAREGSDIREAIEFPETRHFVIRVVRAKERYEELYPDAFDR